jgi:hypothetical protein
MASSVLEVHLTSGPSGAICQACRRVVSGIDGDCKICVSSSDRNIVFCAVCFWNHPRRNAWLEWRSEPPPPVLEVYSHPADDRLRRSSRARAIRSPRG